MSNIKHDPMFVLILILRIWFILFKTVFVLALTIVQALSDIVNILLSEVLIPSLASLTKLLEQLEQPTSPDTFDYNEAENILVRAERRMLDAHTLETGLQATPHN